MFADLVVPRFGWASSHDLCSGGCVFPNEKAGAANEMPHSSQDRA